MADSRGMGPGGGCTGVYTESIIGSIGMRVFKQNKKKEEEKRNRRNPVGDFQNRVSIEMIYIERIDQ
jgi:hypothetical protein